MGAVPNSFTDFIPFLIMRLPAAGAGLLCVAQGSDATAGDEVIMLHVNHITEELDSLNEFAEEEGGRTPTEISPDEINRCKVVSRWGSTSYYSFLANNGACNDGTSPCEGDFSCHYFGDKCEVGSDCTDCGNCPGRTDFDHHRIHDKNTNVCPENHETITSESMCQSAASAVGAAYRSKVNDGSKPRGCYLHDDDDGQYAYFNAHSRGHHTTHGAPLCSKHCHVDQCNGHGTTEDKHSEDGCDCTCTENWTGQDCSEPPPGYTTPHPRGLVETVECGGSYDFTLNRGEYWYPKVRGGEGVEVKVSTCAGRSSSGSVPDTVINHGRDHGGCENDDANGACGYGSECVFMCERELQELKISFFSNGGGSSTLDVVCEGPPTTTSTTTTSTLFTHPDLVYGGMNTCPELSSIIMQKGICETAAGNIQATFSGEENDADRPTGCYLYQGEVFFNAHFRGKHLPEAQSICAKSCHADTDCNGHPTIDVNKMDGCVCDCRTGYSGDECEVPPPCDATVHCSGHGTTNDMDSTDANGCLCQCQEEHGGRWGGVDCSIPPSCSSDTHCNGHATVDMNATDGCTCSCADGFSGHDCKTPPEPCERTDCNYPTGGDLTHDRDANRADGCPCTCKDGWSGDKCQTQMPIPACTPEGMDGKGCHGHGTTQDADSRDGCVCQCDEVPGVGKYQGADCSVAPECSSDTHCNGRATHKPTFDEEDDDCQCICIEGWTGDACEIPPPPTPCDKDVDCNGNGKTEDLDKSDGCECQCDDWHSGDACEISNIPKCTATEHCSNHGSTSDLDARDGCTCNCIHDTELGGRWSGIDCSIEPKCNSVAHCNGHAVKDTNANAGDGCECVCNEGWTGDQCEIEPPPPPVDENALECGKTYDFKLEQRNSLWTRPINVEAGKVVELHTCEMTSGDTHIHDPCDNDDWGGYFINDPMARLPISRECKFYGLSYCKFTATGHEGNASVGFYAGGTGSGKLSVRCSDAGSTTTTTSTSTTTEATTTTIATTTTTTTWFIPYQHGSACTHLAERQVTPPALVGGCQRCTCVNFVWQCACSMRHRKEVDDMTDAEFDRFAMALNKMKSDGMWDFIAQMHAASEEQDNETTEFDATWGVNRTTRRKCDHGEHGEAGCSASHGDPKTFLPWHRKFFVEVESRLQMASKQLGNSNELACSVSIPYWNWALDGSKFSQAKVFSANRLGSHNIGAVAKSWPAGGMANPTELDQKMCVMDGKFGVGAHGSEFGKHGNNFQRGIFNPDGDEHLMLDAVNDGIGSDCIMRGGKTNSYTFDQSGALILEGRALHELSYVDIVTKLQENEKYDGIASYENMALFIERVLHNEVHGVLGGSMDKPNQRWQYYHGHMTTMYSPYDPIFFFHHGFIDYLWSQWQDTHVEGPWRHEMRESHMMRRLLWDGVSDKFPVSDVAMLMDIKDDNPWTDRSENVCVKYHERESNHACNPKSDPLYWDRIKDCFHNLVTYEKLHAVPRLRDTKAVSDVCEPLGGDHFDHNRMWLETMVQAGMMDESHVDRVLQWERNEMKDIENNTATVDFDTASECDKTLCFSATTMLQICTDCANAGWTLDCHCYEGGIWSEGSACHESRF